MIAAKPQVIKGDIMNVYETKTVTERLAGNSYPGRGIIIGTTPDEKMVVAYFIMGRSENSRNRVFEQREDGLYTKAYDESKVADPSLIIYRAVGEHEGNIVVTNGDQTDTILSALKVGGSFEGALRTREFEPDAPSFTPRISGMVCYDFDVTYKLSILKSADAEGTDCVRYFYEYPATPGVGHFIHTYVGDGSPLPSFQGEPERVVIPEDTEAFADELWASLDENNKISLYVNVIDEEGETAYIYNKNEEE